MPAPLGGALALHKAASHSALLSMIGDPELEEIENQKIFIQANLDCRVKLHKNVIPPGKGKLVGELVLKAFKDIEVSGIFLLMRGLPLDPKMKSGEKHLSSVKFLVEGSIGGDDGGECRQIEKNTRETYQLDFEIPEELPSPVITPEGKLTFMMEAFVSTPERRHVKVAEVPVRWMGNRVLKREEIDKQLVLEQHVFCKRTLAGMGRRKSCRMEWRVEKGGYLPGEGILVEVLGESKVKTGLKVEVLLEFVQKVWYQVPSTSSKGTMWVNMIVNVLASAKSEEAFEVDGGKDGKKVVWMGKLKVPKGITPTHKFELINSVSYAIRASVGVSGEPKEGWVKGEVSLLIGTSREVMEGDEQTEDEKEHEVDDEQVLHQFSPSGSISHFESGSRLHRRGSGGLTMFKRTQSTAFIHGRPRIGSVSSIDTLHCFGSSTLRVFKVPLNYSPIPSRSLLQFGLSTNY